MSIIIFLANNIFYSLMTSKKDIYTKTKECELCITSTPDDLLKCGICKTAICSACYNDKIAVTKCICKNTKICKKCPPLSHECKECKAVHLLDSCSKVSCTYCKIGCFLCSVSCLECRKFYCKSCWKKHIDITCITCNKKFKICSYCSSCQKSVCDECIKQCSCCIKHKLCTSCMCEHNMNRKTCDLILGDIKDTVCKTVLCCSGCSNPLHSKLLKCIICSYEQKKIIMFRPCQRSRQFKIACSVKDCTSKTLIYTCCNISHNPQHLVIINSLIWKLVDNFTFNVTDNKVYCITHSS